MLEFCTDPAIGEAVIIEYELLRVYVLQVPLEGVALQLFSQPFPWGHVTVIRRLHRYVDLFNSRVNHFTGAL